MDKTVSEIMESRFIKSVPHSLCTRKCEVPENCNFCNVKIEKEDKMILYCSFIKLINWTHWNLCYSHWAYKVHAFNWSVKLKGNKILWTREWLRSVQGSTSMVANWFKALNIPLKIEFMKLDAYFDYSKIFLLMYETFQILI